MVTYIYFVKCPNCEDEPFDFFDEAKGYAMGCLSQKPVITQTEVCRNDFGECTDSADLGQVWSWEDECEPEAEPITFSKDDINTAYDPDNDPEFQDDDFFAINAEDSKEPITEEFDRVRAAAQCSRNCYDFYKAVSSKAPAKDIKKFAKAAAKFVKDQYGLTGEAAEDLLWSGYVVWKRLHENNKTESCERKPIPEGMTIFEEVNSRGGYYVLGYHNNNEYVFWTDPKRFFRSEDDCYTTELTADVVKFQTYEQANAHSNDADEQYRKSTGYDEYYVTIEPYRTGEYVIVGTYESTKKYWNGYEWLDSIDEECIMSERIATEEKRYVDRRVSNISMFKPMYVDSNGNLHDDYQRKPIPEGMTIEQLVEEMEENEDTVECTWCEELFDKSECRKEVDLGWLCSRCEMAIKSRGETLTFREGNYWDFLDEDAEPHDLGNEYDGGYPATQTWVCYVNDVDIGTVEAATEDEALEKMQQEYPEYPYGLRHEIEFWAAPADDSLFESVLTEAAGYDCPKLKEADNNKPGAAKFKILFWFERNPAAQGLHGGCPYLSGRGSDATFKNVILRDITGQSYGGVEDIELADNGEVMLITTIGKKYSLRQALKIASPATDKFSNTRKVLLALKDAAEAAEKTLDTKTVRNLRVRNALAQLDETVAKEFKAAITNIVFRIPSHNAYSAEDILDIDPDASEAVAEKAAEKINKIHDDFYGLPFVSANKDQMESSGMIEERVPAEKAAWINSSWGAVGKIYFDRPINQLSADAQKIIANAKLSDANVDPTANSVDCYRLATELIRFFGNDPWFYTKPVESDDDDVDTEEPEVVDDAFDLDFPEA